MLAFRYLRARGKDSFISVIAIFSFIGVMLGVATLIIVMSVMNGFRKELVSKLLGLNGHVLIQPIESPLTDYKDVVERILKVPGVVSGARASSKARRSSRRRSVRRACWCAAWPAPISRKCLASRIIFAAAGLRISTMRRTSSSARALRAQLGLNVGDKITLIQPRGSTTPMGVVPRLKAFTIVAEFEIGMSVLDSSSVFIPFEQADSFFDKHGEASVIEVFIDDPDRIDEMRPMIEKAAGRPVLLTDWRQTNRSFFSALEVERNVMFLILMLIVLVAALNIVSGMIMLVKDKSSAIAILRTMGATQGTIMRVFLITGGAIGVVGTLAGFALGLVITLNVETIRQFLSRLTSTNLFPPELYFLSQLPAELDWREVATITLTALALSVLATLYPAWKAASLDPVEQLRRG